MNLDEGKGEGGSGGEMLVGKLKQMQAADLFLFLERELLLVGSEAQKWPIGKIYNEAETKIYNKTKNKMKTETKIENRKQKQKKRETERKRKTKPAL